jgi:agmatine/peptidylarginine deiminase
MTAEYPSIALIETNMPEQYESWKRALEHAEFTYEELIKRPIRHTDYPYQ